MLIADSASLHALESRSFECVGRAYRGAVRARFRANSPRRAARVYHSRTFRAFENAKTTTKTNATTAGSRTFRNDREAHPPRAHRRSDDHQLSSSPLLEPHTH